MDSNGKIDIHAGSDISMHTGLTLIYIAQEVPNVEADSINPKARGDDGIKIERA